MAVELGIANLLQVNGRSDVSQEERVRLDMLHIRDWSISLDIQILSQGVLALIKVRQAD